MTTVNKTEAFPQLTDNSVKVLNRRYLKKNDETKIPTEIPDTMFRRVADNLAEADRGYGADNEQVTETSNKFYRIMRRLEFIPNSPTLMNAGRDLQQLSACFVLPIEDDLSKIFMRIHDTAMIHQSGGGTGFAFSRLRPEGDKVQSTGGIASGPCSFIKAYDMGTEVVKQGGTRRGANMGVLSVYHPDVMKFIQSKSDGVSLQNFNISIAVDRRFMEKALENKDYTVVNPRNNQNSGVLNAGQVLKEIVNNAWLTGDPGLLFIDRMNADNPNPQLGQIESTNPCGEQSLLPYESCNLGSINLARMTKTTDDGKRELDLEKLKDTAKTAVHMLDNVIDMNQYPLDEIEVMTKKTRRIGVGIMGWADFLIQLDIQYDSEEGVELARQTMRQIRETVYEASQDLAKIRGTFPEWEYSIYKDGPPMRNSAPTTIAPTGTISIIAGASSGIEPLFALAYVRNVMDNTELGEVNENFVATAQEMGFYSEDLMQRIGLESGHIPEDANEVPEHIKNIYRTSHQISPEWHVKMQAAFQSETDNAVSKTINLPNSATIEDVWSAYLLAYNEGCKGITVYRDGSKEGQVLSTPTTTQNERNQHVTPRQWERPRRIQGTTERVNTSHGGAYVTVNKDDDGNIVEVFAAVGKPGGCDQTVMQVLTRMTSIALQYGVPPEDVIRQLKGSSCCPMYDNGTLVLSPSDAIGIALERILMPEESHHEPNAQTMAALPAKMTFGNTTNGQTKFIALPQGTRRCPECNGFAILQEGCLVCHNCGWQKC